MTDRTENQDPESRPPVSAAETQSQPAPNAADNEGADAAPARDQDSLHELMAFNFIEYASYVIRERAIPDVVDGLKPVQRRILHSLHEIDDGRFHKVANVIGHTMRYHPHGDASIGNALVVLANKEYFIEEQGNFGNIVTGDRASAARYIECRLTPLAKEVLFNPEITEFVDSYDSRNREPVVLPAKVPALLMLGAEGIAVGMTTRVFPHNFRELLEAQIAVIENRPFQLYPDFLTGGTMDVGAYEDGAGRIKVRARIEKINDKTIVIREIPATTTTEALIASIEEAARRGKIKITEINDYTADVPEIEITLPRGTYAKDAIKQLYAYTDCQISLRSNIVVIHQNQPRTFTVSEALELNTAKLVAYLQRELEIELGKLQDRYHEKTLAQIFVEHRIYKRIEECGTYEEVLSEVRKGLEPFAHELRREISDDDIEKLLQLQIRRISRFDIDKNQQELKNIEKSIKTARHHLEHPKQYAKTTIRNLLKKYGARYPRRTKIADLEQIDVKAVALQNIKVGHDRVGHFVGTDVKNSNKSDAPLVCTEFDRLVLLQNDGVLKVIPIPDKIYVGPVKYLLKADKEQVYSLVYRERKRRVYYAKRFRIDRYIMDREYRAIPKDCIIEALYTNYGVTVRCELKPNPRFAANSVDVDFDEIAVRSVGARGFIVTKQPVVSFVQIKRGSPMAPDEDTGATEEEPAPDPADPEETAAPAPETDHEHGSPAAETEPNRETEAESAAAAETPKPTSSRRRSEAGKARKSRKTAPEQAETDSKRTRKPGRKSNQKASASSASGTEQAALAATAETPPDTRRNLAREWGERSHRAARVKPAPESDAETPPSGQATAGQPAAAAEPATGSSPDAAAVQESEAAADMTGPEQKGDPRKSGPRVRIDEETPFFLE